MPAPVGAAELAGVTLRVADQKGGSKALLTAAGLLADVPYRIEWSTFTSGPPLLEAVSAGGADVGRVGNTPPIFAAAAGAKISVVATSRGNAESDAILVPKDSPLRTVADLRGRTIGVAKGSSAHGQVLLNLRKAGLSKQDVKLSFLQPADAYGAFRQKQIDAWAAWDPYTSQALLEAGARVLADGNGTANGLSFLAAGTSALSDAGRNTAIRDFVTRHARAERWADGHRDEWAATWAKETGLDIGVARAAVARGPDLPVPLDDAVVASEQELADTFHADGVLPSRVDFAALVDRRYAQDLDKIRG
ncbi:ABC transporter substrate-binding protein [Amycolatopsis suaedae]|uniref:Putative aliphatic sulfonates-binding protein n=1 Tax=Amycolatopsis suaedae TaxID=2510978 RepID=A0A4Q7IZ37_9PSEU|nr:ABC transporter substrate-binding protein [Amycolatopsis suaedae]RZQ59727.1 ABC transporter substrate-binding protein [Amycolatopsis suaedae]